jgi:hypothetical protein
MLPKREAFLNTHTIKAPEGFAVCPCCNGSGENKEQPLKEYEKKWSFNLGREFERCLNCGGQYMSCASSGFSRIDPNTGLGCKHEYKYRSAGRCYHEYTCKNCNERYYIDSGD